MYPPSQVLCEHGNLSGCEICDVPDRFDSLTPRMHRQEAGADEYIKEACRFVSELSAEHGWLEALVWHQELGKMLLRRFESALRFGEVEPEGLVLPLGTQIQSGDFYVGPEGKTRTADDLSMVGRYVTTAADWMRPTNKR